MEFKKVKDFKDNGVSGSIYDTDKSLDVDTIIKVIKHYENENTKLYECRCDTFSESGRPYSPKIYDTKDLDRLHEFENPSISVSAKYVDPKDLSYKFTISMAANAKGLNYYYSKDDADYVKYNIELDRMEAEAEKKSQENQMNNKNTYQK